MLKYRLWGTHNCLCLTGRAPSHVVPHYWESRDPVKYANTAAKKGMQYGIMISVKTDGDIFNHEEKIIIQNAARVTLYVNIETSFNGFEKHPEFEGKDFKNILKMQRPLY